QDETVVALDLTFQPGPNVCNPRCVSPRFCRNNVCVSNPVSHKCDPACPEGDQCVNGRCVDKCQPHCRPPMTFCDNGRCVRTPPN
ncbi:MAG TPA: hypothetical protein VLX44_10605, partial [Xanthobacteraceae bacterium]|nr:hypothetical protein [Xanthobacteraceae bacterium]